MKQITLGMLLLVALISGMQAQNRTSKGGQPKDPATRAQNMTTRMKTQYGLSDAQAKQVYQANLEMIQAQEKMREEQSAARNQHQSKRAEIAKQHEAALSTILSESQMQMHKEKQEEKRLQQERMREERKSDRREMMREQK
jgi:hypothetical protein